MTAEHGTPAGYERHRRLDEQACGNCLWAHNQYNKDQLSEQNRIRRQLKKRGLVPHGQAAGLRWHLGTHSPVCEMCLTYVCNLELDAALRSRRRGAA